MQRIKIFDETEAAKVKIIFKKSLLILSLLSILLAVSCGSIDAIDSAIGHDVTFVYGDGRESVTKSYKNGALLNEDVPTREGYEFVGWSTNSDHSNFYDYSRPIRDDLTLYARWTVDYADLIDRVNENAVKSSVKVVVPTYYGSSQQGSGVVYRRNGHHWYVLTNSHVVTYQGKTMTNANVYDAYGKEYSATVLKADAKYDLAVLKMYVTGINSFNVANIGNRIPDKDEPLVTVSTPNGMWNTVGIGSCAWYHKLSSENKIDENEIDFEVLWLDAEADHGSSGGAVYDSELNVVGIIYGIVTLSEGDEMRVLAVPAPKVLEFLSSVKY